MAHKKPLYEKVLTHFGGIIIVGVVVKKGLVETEDTVGGLNWPLSKLLFFIGK